MQMRNRRRIEGLAVEGVDSSSTKERVCVESRALLKKGSIPCVLFVNAP